MHGRRTFLKYAGMTAAGLGITAGVTPRGAQAQAEDPAAPVLRVQLDAPAGPLVERTVAILKDRIQQRCAVRVVEARGHADVVLALDASLAAEAFQIDAIGDAVRVAGGSPNGLLYGVGKFLRTSQYASGFEPSRWRGTSEPHGTLRGMYFAMHFSNWYHQAPEAEITRYMEDLALWGVNAVMAIFPFINLTGWDDPRAKPAMDTLRTCARTARALGIQFVTGLNNAFFVDPPEAIRAARLPDPLGRRGNHGHPVCPSRPEGHAYIMEHTRRLFEELSEVGLDVACFWPYDEGGCACAQCATWGSNGYLKLSEEMARLGREYFPHLKTILSTWMFDTPPEGEWQGLSDALNRDGDWLDYILADAHEDYPRYPLDTGVPGQRPLLNFPEISMWGNWPWGGYGANPLPGRFQRLWDQVKHLVTGGLPYSEGIYEDMNKAVVVQFYWDRDRAARATLEEYIAYEFGPGVTPEVLELVDLLEIAAGQSYQKQAVEPAGALRAWSLAEGVHARLPTWAQHNWRWEILYLRALIDRERFAGEGLEAPEAQAAMLRLIEIYHAQLESNDPYHHRVRPPHQDAVDRAGKA